MFGSIQRRKDSAGSHRLQGRWPAFFMFTSVLDDGNKAATASRFHQSQETILNYDIYDVSRLHIRGVPMTHCETNARIVATWDSSP